MRRWIKLIVIISVLMLVCAPAGAMAKGPIVIKFGHHHAVGGAEDAYAHKFGELVKAKSNGGMDVKVLPGAQLGQEGEAAEGYIEIHQ